MRNDKYSKNDRDSMFDDDYVDGMDMYEDEDVYDSYEEENDYDFRDSRSASRRKKTKFNFSFKKALLILALILIAVVFVSFLTIPQKTNFLVMATDEDGTRTDTIMIISYDKKSDGVTVVSVPRDTYVTVSDSMYVQMSASYPEPGSKSMKINAVHHFMGSEEGPEALCSVVEELMDIDINYYARVDFDAFKYIIDSIGGVDFYVPCDMSYNDPMQNLTIDLEEGQQVLDGEQAEQVVRYRSGYKNGDLGRIQVQQDFMKAFISQAVSPIKIITHPGAYINVLFNYIDTNFGMIDLISYTFVVFGVDTDGVETSVLPGNAQLKNGQSVYVVDESQLYEFTSDLR